MPSLNSSQSVSRAIVAILLIWVVTTAFVLRVSFKEEQATKLISEISISIDKLRQVLFIQQPYRSKLSQRIELDLQLIHAQTMQLKAYTESGTSSDLTHTVYLLERFIEQSQQLSHDEVRLKEFVQNISVRLPTLSEQGQKVSNELSSVVLDALFNEALEARQVYLKLEEIQHAAYQLPQDDRQSLLLLNSQASVLLAQSANTEFLLDRVVNHSVVAELAARSRQSETYLGQQLLILALVSLLSLMSVFALSRRQLVISISRVDKDPTTMQNVTPIEAVSTPSKNTIESDDVCKPQAMESRPPHNEEILASRTPAESEVPKADIVEEQGGPTINFETMLHTLDGDKASMLMLLDVFVNEHTEDIAKFQQCLENDLDAATRVVHTLKGVSGSIYAEALHHVSSEAEKVLKDHGEVTVELLERLRVQLSYAIRSAKDYIQAEQSR